MTEASDPEGDKIYYRYFVIEPARAVFRDSGYLEDPYWGFEAPDYATTLEVEVWASDVTDDWLKCNYYPPSLTITIIVQRAFIN